MLFRRRPPQHQQLGQMTEMEVAIADLPPWQTVLNRIHDSLLEIFNHDTLHFHASVYIPGVRLYINS